MNEQVNMAARYEHEITKGYQARIEGNKVILEPNKSEDEKIRKALLAYFKAQPEHYTFKSISVPEIVAYLEKQKEQKHAEWSEEDEFELECILSHLKEYLDEDSYIGYEKWLKSLRPSWKPSKEQIEEIFLAIDCFEENGEDSSILHSLLDDLNKL